MSERTDGRSLQIGRLGNVLPLGGMVYDHSTSVDLLKYDYFSHKAKMLGKSKSSFECWQAIPMASASKQSTEAAAGMSEK